MKGWHDSRGGTELSVFQVESSGRRIANPLDRHTLLHISLFIQLPGYAGSTSAIIVLPPQ